jgi:hypothetical protein
MKKLLLLSGIAGSLFTSCDKGVTTASAVYRGLVIHNKCCQIVIQNLGNPAVGQATWVDSNNVGQPTLYDVFRVGNPCEFVSHQEGDTIQYRVIQAPHVQNCNCCMLFLYTPQVSKYISVL